MRATTTTSNIKNLGLAIVSVAAALMLLVSWLATAANASSINRVSSNIADVPDGANLVLTVGTQNDGDAYELEIDHSLQGTLPEFSVYADEANPYGGLTCGTNSDQDCQTQFEDAGVSITYSATSNQWVIDFGSAITNVIRTNGQINFYLVLRDADDNILWGSMDQTTDDNTFTFDAVAGTGDTLVPEASEDDDEEEDEADEAVVPGVPNTSLGL